MEHVHVWSITSGRILATLEVGLADGTDPAVAVPAVKAALKARYAIGHTTVEVMHARSAADADCGLRSRS